jgi:putative N6-adenine-specific DNA methylase
MNWMATAAFGLEGVVRKELNRMGFADAQAVQGGVRFEGTPADAFKACLWLRTADRVLLIAGEGKATSFEELFMLVRGIPWADYLPRDARFPVTGHCARSQLMSVSDCQAITKKAIVESLKEKYKLEWFAETGMEYRVNVSLHSDVATITLDACGEALNKRGYRTWNGEAPLRETLAAALVLLSSWRRDTPLHDPCCGTGTLLIEAAFIMADRAPGLARAFAMESWGFVSGDALAPLRDEAKARFDPERVLEITGSDIDEGALTLCNKHITQAGLEGRITVTRKDLRELRLGKSGICFITNPPYGERMGDAKACESLYRGLAALQAAHPDSRMNVIASQPGFERIYGRRAMQKRRLYNGRLECEFMRF